MTRPNDLLNGRYRVVRSVAKGGMGAVLEGIDERLNRVVAIKIVRPELVKDPVLRARFDREARAAAGISHPNVVQVYDLDVTPDGVAFLVMEWMAGDSLASRLRGDGKLEPRRAASLVEQALRGLHAAHCAGIVHRDLKPGNLMLTETAGADLVKVVDFGIAQLKNGAEYTRLTMTGEIIGTPAFMPPEQLQGGAITPATDVYAMGVVLWCLLTGRMPFGSGADVIMRVLTTTPPRADAIEPTVPRAMADIAERAMQRDPTARFVSALEMADALRTARGATSFGASAPFGMPAPTFANGMHPAHTMTAHPGTSPMTSPFATRASHPGFAPPSAQPIAASQPSPPPDATRRTLVIALACFVPLLAGSVFWILSRRPGEARAVASAVPFSSEVPAASAGPAINPTVRAACERAVLCCHTLMPIAGGNPASCDLLTSPRHLVRTDAESTCRDSSSAYERVLAMHGLRCEGAGAPSANGDPTAAAAACMATYRCCLLESGGDATCDSFRQFASSPDVAVRMRSVCESSIVGLRRGAIAAGRPCDGSPR